MNPHAMTRDQVRQVDQIAIQQYGIPGIVLMENAGRGAADVIDRVAPPGRITILCGSGNNAGDGYVIARHLQLHNRDVRLVTIVDLDSLQGDAKINAVIASHSGIDIRHVQTAEQLRDAISDAAALVDALLGTGAKGALRGLYPIAVALANELTAKRIAIDIPTGLDCDTGIAGDPTFRADHTVTFVAPKVGFQRNNADEFVGVVHVVEIGVPKKLLEQL